MTGSDQTDRSLPPAETAPAVGELSGEIAITDPSQARVLDAQYLPLPPFGDWARLGVDEQVWETRFNEFDERRVHSSSDSLNLAIDVALTAAAVDTGAIEGLYDPPVGFTISVATRQPGWEALVERMGTDFQTHFEAQLRAYELAQRLAATETGVTEAWIRQLHSELAKGQTRYRVLTAVGWQEHDLPLGEYKQHPNHVRLTDGSFHSYAPVAATASEMQRLTTELRTDAFAKAHPVLQASYAHFALVSIHPFADGNGRVARALASTFLSRSVGVPLVIFVDQRRPYFASLELGDRGHHQAFVDFIFDRSVDSLDFVSYRLGPSPEAQVSKLREILRAGGPLSPAEVDQVAAILNQALLAEVTQQVALLSMPTGIQLNAQQLYEQVKFGSKHYRPFVSGSQQIVRLVAVTMSVPQINLTVDLPVLAATDSSQRYICAIIGRRPGGLLEIRLDELVPQISSALRLKLSSWVARLIADMLEEFAAMYRKAAKGEGDETAS